MKYVEPTLEELAGQTGDQAFENPFISTSIFQPANTSSMIDYTEDDKRKPRSKSREMCKKMGGGKKGLWGKPEDLLTVPRVDRGDPNFDSEDDESNPNIILVPAANSPSKPPSSSTARHPNSSSIDSFVDGFEDPQIFGISTPAAMKKKFEVIIDEYFVSGDLDDIQHSLSDLDADMYQHEFVKRIITMSMDKHDKEREMTSRLMSDLYLNGLTPLQIKQGLRRVLIYAEDLKCDIPNIQNMLAIFMARAVVDEIIPPSFLEDTCVVEYAQHIAAEAIQKLSINHGTVRMEKGWGPGDGRCVEELKVAIDQLTKEYLLSQDLQEACRCVRELNVPHFHHELVKRGIINAMEEGKKELCEIMVSLFAFLLSQDIVSKEQLVKGFEKVKMILPDITLDIPQAVSLFQLIVSRSQSDGILASAFHA